MLMGIGNSSNFKTYGFKIIIEIPITFIFTIYKSQKLDSIFILHNSSFESLITLQVLRIVDNFMKYDDTYVVCR